MKAALLETRIWSYQTGNEALWIPPAWMNVSLLYGPSACFIPADVPKQKELELKALFISLFYCWVTSAGLVDF
jgi:hypothetical protein